MSSWRNQAFQSRREVSCSRGVTGQIVRGAQGFGAGQQQGEQTGIRYSVCSLSNEDPASCRGRSRWPRPRRRSATLVHVHRLDPHIDVRVAFAELDQAGTSHWMAKLGCRGDGDAPLALRASSLSVALGDGGKMSLISRK